MDVRDLDPPAADMWWASPPCQAWSKAGARLGAKDIRNGWPWVWEAYDRASVKPHWLFVENVAGMTHHSSSGCGDPATCARCYLDAVVLPELRARFPHVVSRVLDAADYGVPQHRRRLFIVASVKPYNWPQATHGDGLAPYVTCHEAIGLGEGVRVIGGGGNPHGKNKGHERNYRDLTDEPMLTVTAVRVGNRGPWIRDRADLYCSSFKPQRPYTIDEAAQWQGFPRSWPWSGSASSQHRQVGNAVPPGMAEALASTLPDEVEQIDPERHVGSVCEPDKDRRPEGAGVLANNRSNLPNEKSAASDTNSVSSLHDVSLFSDYHLTRGDTAATTKRKTVVNAGPTGALA